MYTMKLSYLNNVYAEQRKTYNGFEEVVGAYNSYKQKSLRNVRVVRIDLLKRLTGIFGSVCMDKRDMLYAVISGDFLVRDAEFVRDAIEAYYKHDETFKMFLSEQYYFRPEETVNLSLYEAVVVSVQNEVRKTKNSIGSYVIKKYLFDSHLYSYVAIRDDVSRDEVLSSIGEYEEVSMW